MHTHFGVCAMYTEALGSARNNMHTNFEIPVIFLIFERYSTEMVYYYHIETCVV